MCESGVRTTASPPKGSLSAAIVKRQQREPKPALEPTTKYRSVDRGAIQSSPESSRRPTEAMKFSCLPMTDPMKTTLPFFSLLAPLYCPRAASPRNG